MPREQQPKPEQNERYTYGQSQGVTQVLGRRTAATHAAFFTPYLRPGMNLLDCGCGPGTITLDLAEFVAPGQVVGVDMAENQLEEARASLEQRRLSNIRFETANAYELPFSDNTFDAVFSHALVEHLSDPHKALREQYRVLKPGGVLGIRNADNDGHLFWPDDSRLSEWFELHNRLLQYNGANPFIGRQLRSLLNEIGLQHVAASASYECHGTTESVRWIADFIADYIRGVQANQVVELGWLHRSQVEELRTAWQEWGASPDAFLARPWCEAVGWKD